MRTFCLLRSVDLYDSELEQMNVTLGAENQGLLHDNKQLGGLIKEYEQTLESVMGAFRTRAVRHVSLIVDMVGSCLVAAGRPGARARVDP